MPKTTTRRFGAGKKAFLALNLSLLAVVGWSLSGEYYRNRALQQEIDALEARAADLSAGNRELADLRERLGGVGELEREARLKLNLQKPGEEVVVLQNEPDAWEETGAGGREGTAHAADTPEERTRSNARGWLQFLFPQIDEHTK